MVHVFFADGTSREIFGAYSAELSSDKVLVKNRHGGLVNVFPAKDVVRAEVKDRGEIKYVVVVEAK